MRLPNSIVLTTGPAEREQDKVGRYCRLWLASLNKSNLNYLLFAAVELQHLEIVANRLDTVPVAVLQQLR